MPTTVSIIKVTKHKSRPFGNAISMLKKPKRSVYIGNIYYYLIYLASPFLRDLEVDLEGSSTFPILTLSLLY